MGTLLQHSSFPLELSTASGSWCPSRMVPLSRDSAVNISIHSAAVHVPASRFSVLQLRHQPFLYQILTCATPRMPLSAPPPTSAVPPPLPSNYVENGRLYHGFRKGRYMYPCDEASLPQFPTILQSLSWRADCADLRGFSTGGNGSHGYLSQVLLGREARSITFDALHAQLRSRATDSRLGNWDGNMGNRYGRVSTSRNLLPT